MKIWTDSNGKIYNQIKIKYNVRGGTITGKIIVEKKDIKYQVKAKGEKETILGEFDTKINAIDNAVKLAKYLPQEVELIIRSDIPQEVELTIRSDI